MPEAIYRAIHRNARISPRKTRLVADLIRGKSVPRAIEILAFSDKRAASLMIKVLKSAVANAGQDVDSDRLVVSTVLVNEGPRLKRIFPRPRGVATPIARPMCHIQVEVAAAVGGGEPGRILSPSAQPGTTPESSETT